jgi:peptidoglycan L-alanyl-D-glutamate endopeptidase CwlK
MPFTFGNRSNQNLDTCHEDLKKIMHLAISRTNVDFGISEGHRSLERQKQLFDEGKSKIDGINKKGKHNYNPSLAVDIYAYHPDIEMRRKLAYDRMTLAYIGGIIDSCAAELLEKGETNHTIRWGANWDSDGVIDYDQDFDDYPHFELKEV